MGHIINLVTAIDVRKFVNEVLIKPQGVCDGTIAGVRRIESRRHIGSRIGNAGKRRSHLFCCTQGGLGLCAYTEIDARLGIMRDNDADC